MTAKTVEVEVWVVVDQDGQRAVGTDQATALASYDENVGRDDENPVGLRFVRVLVKVPLPVTIELKATAGPGEEVSSATVQRLTG